MRRTFLIGSLGVLAALAFAPGGTRAAACSDIERMMADFKETYPTGGPMERIAGARGQAALDFLAPGSMGKGIAFLYSGDGPVTGARGRYLYLVLDGEECILDLEWIDHATYDRAVPAE